MSCPECGSEDTRWIGYGSDWYPALKVLYYTKTHKCNNCVSYWREEYIIGTESRGPD